MSGFRWSSLKQEICIKNRKTCDQNDVTFQNKKGLHVWFFIKFVNLKKQQQRVLM